MSGGTFDYNQYRINEIADQIERIVYSESWSEYWYSPETIVELKRGVKLLQQAFVYAQRIDWLVAGDDGEDSFHQRLKEDLAKLGAE